MEKLSKGDYKINLKESNSEFGKLAKSFNKMSKELEKRNNDLIESANNKQLFIDNLSHEMNTPLTSIQGYAELLQKANLTEEQKDKYLTYIQSESKRISDMYKKLLLLSYKKNADLDFKNVNISNVFSEIYKSQKNRLDSKNIDLIINNQLENIYGDETLIIMCVSNLVKNAINVSDVNSKIIINALKINDKKYIQVVDYGPGISKENIAKITEPFYRVDKVRSRKNGGAGLGLSICKSIMELHKGDLKIESDIGKGSIFILEFPK
jgi:signal transduction histidine kinase